MRSGAHSVEVPVDTDGLKRQAAEAAVEQVESGMVVGLGHGSTALWALRAIAARLQDGTLRNVHGVPCSVAVAREAEALGIALSSLEATPDIDITIDGADEVSPALDLIKGGGGALLREKVVAQASKRVVIVVDGSKLSPALGTRWPIPIEVIPFAWRPVAGYLEKAGAEVERRRQPDGTPFETDQGNFILDCNFGAIAEPQAVAARFDTRAGIVEHGLFLGLASEVIVAGEDGIRHLHRADPS